MNEQAQLLGVQAHTKVDAVRVAAPLRVVRVEWVVDQFVILGGPAPTGRAAQISAAPQDNLQV